MNFILYYTISDAVDFLRDNIHVNDGMTYSESSVRKIVQTLINQHAIGDINPELEFDSSESLEYKVYSHFKRFPDVEIKIIHVDDNGHAEYVLSTDYKHELYSTEYYEDFTSIEDADNHMLVKNPKSFLGSPKYLFNEQFLIALDLYLEDEYFNNPKNRRKISSNLFFGDSLPTRDEFKSKIIGLDRDEFKIFVIELVDNLNRELQHKLDDDYVARINQKERLFLIYEKYQTLLLFADRVSNSKIAELYSIMMHELSSRIVLQSKISSRFQTSLINSVDEDALFPIDEHFGNKLSDTIVRHILIVRNKLNETVSEDETSLKNPQEVKKLFDSALKRKKYNKYNNLLYLLSGKLISIIKREIDEIEKQFNKE